MDHYENFPVASWLCPPALRPPILAIYRFARTADDLADEGGASAEKRLADLNAEHMARVLAVNALGPAIWLKHAVALLPRQGRCVVATLSARVGSIGDTDSAM